MNDVITFVFEILNSIFSLVLIPEVELGNNTYTVTIGQFLVTAMIIVIVLALFVPKWRNT